MAETKSSDLSIDVGQVIAERLPRHSRYIPRAVIKWLEHFIRQDRMNELLQATAGLRGADFCRGVLEHLGITYHVVHEELLPKAGDTMPDGTDARRVVIVSNHPLGGLDGMVLIDMLARHTSMTPRFVVNDLLMAVKPLDNVFLPVNKHGRQGRAEAGALDRAFDSEVPIVVFPAGLVSRKGSDGRVADLRWHKMFVNRCIRHQRDVIPLYFSGSNSSFFYNFARLRTRLGLKFNLEMLQLPAEIFRAEKSHFTLVAGPRVSWRQLHGGSGADEQAAELRRTVYNLSH